MPLHRSHRVGHDCQRLAEIARRRGRNGRNGRNGRLALLRLWRLLQQRRHVLQQRVAQRQGCGGVGLAQALQGVDAAAAQHR